MYRIGLIMIIAALLVTPSLGCGNSEPTPTITGPAYADEIAEKLILAYDAKDYAAYLESFDADATGSVGRDWFNQTAIIVQKKIGNYIPDSKVLIEVKPSGVYTEVIYKAQYSDEPDGVQVIVDLDISENGTFAAGIWFNSPKLFK